MKELHLIAFKKKISESIPITLLNFNQIGHNYNNSTKEKRTTVTPPNHTTFVVSRLANNLTQIKHIFQHESLT